MKRKKALISEDVTLWQHDDTAGVVIPDIRIKAASSGDRFGHRCFFVKHREASPVFRHSTPESSSYFLRLRVKSFITAFLLPSRENPGMSSRILGLRRFLVAG